MKHLHLAYCQENEALAIEIERSMPDVECIHHANRPETPAGTFAQEIQETHGPVVLLLTDNFLKSEPCMAGVHPMLLSLLRQSRLLVVIADGVTWQNGVAVPVETHLEKVVNAIQYMNFWQQQYLELSEHYNHADDDNRLLLRPALDMVHSIADQIGDMITTLRDADTLKWDYVKEARFVDIYTRLGIPLPPVEPEAVVPAPPPVAVPPTMPDHPVVEVATPSVIPPASPVWFTPAPPVTPVADTTSQPDEHIVSPANSHLNLDAGHYREQEITSTIQDAWSWIDKGNTELGVEILKLALEQYPDHAGLKAALERAQEAVHSPVVTHPDPNEAHAYEVAGDSAFAEEDYLMAKYCWDRAAESDPELPGIWKKLGFLTSDQLTGYTETSIAYLKKAIERTPNDAAVVERLQKLGENVAITEAAPLPPVAEIEPNPEISEVSTPEPSKEATPVVGAVPQATAVRRSEIVLITGATSGIGKATATEFARHGYRLIITGRRAERLYALQESLTNDFGVEVLPLVFDVRDEKAVEGALGHLPEGWANVDILINNAGLAKGLAPIHEGQLWHWETMIDTNLKGLLYVTRIISQGMVARRKGHIVNVSSSAGKEAYPNGNVYCATKFGVEALTRSMRFDLFQYGIRVSQVSPGHVEETEFAVTRFDGDTEKARIYDDFQPLKASDVAETIWFIASRPAHVNVQDVYLLATQQASATVVHRSGRE